MDELRLFISVNITSPEIFTSINDFQQRITFPGIKLVKPELFHFSLHFLGDTPSEKLPQLEKILADVKQAPFTISLEQTGVFPSLQNIKVLWVGVTTGSTELTSLQQQLRKPLEKQGFTTDARPFTPHLTIGRVKFLSPGDKAKTQQALKEHSKTMFGSQVVSTLHVMQSTLTPQGPLYKSLIAQELH